MFPKISHVINDGPLMTQWWPDLGDRRFPMWCSWSMLAMWTTTQQGSSRHHWWYWKITRWKIWSWVDYLSSEKFNMAGKSHTIPKRQTKKSNVATCLFIKSHRAICLRATPFLVVWVITTIQLRQLRDLRLGMRVPAVRQLRWHWEPGGLKRKSQTAPNQRGLKRTVGTYT